ncbi:DUF5688 family protein, partial [Faecalimonas sp.]
AICNMKKNVTLTTMFNQISKIIGFDEDSFPKEVVDDFLYVLSNEKMMYGASVIIIPEIVSKLEKVFGESFVILPSSVNELIITNIDKSYQEFKEMVETVNEKELEEK